MSVGYLAPEPVCHSVVCVGNNKIDDSDYIGNRKNYVVKNQQTFLNGFLSVITLGIYTPMTVSFEVPIDELGQK